MKTIHFLAGAVVGLALFATVMVRADNSSTNSPAANTPAAKPIPYPLKTCPVSDDKLGEMGDPCVFVYKGQEIKLCCSGCKKDFMKDPAKYLKKIKEEAAKLKK